MISKFWFRCAGIAVLCLIWIGVLALNLTPVSASSPARLMKPSHPDLILKPADTSDIAFPFYALPTHHSISKGDPLRTTAQCG
jgi:hypothetical protein